MVYSTSNASSLFTSSCAYELILNVYKRNIVNCYGDYLYYQTGYYSFTVLFDQVCGPPLPLL